MTDDTGTASEDTGEGEAVPSEGTGLVAYAGLGGLVACCAVIELLGGAVVLGGLAAFLGLSTGITYVTIAGVGGILAAMTVVAYGRVRASAAG